MRHPSTHAWLLTYPAPAVHPAFVMGCCWSCTRPYAALVLFAIALSGGVLCSTGSWPLVVVWAVASLAGFLFYFVFLPDADHVPPWCQSVGPIKASMDPQVWERLATAQIQQDWDSLDALDAKAYQYEFDYAYSHTAGGPGRKRASVSV